LRLQIQIADSNCTFRLVIQILFSKPQFLIGLPSHQSAI
jgi:hypothetical protein